MLVAPGVGPMVVETGACCTWCWAYGSRNSIRVELFVVVTEMTEMAGWCGFHLWVLVWQRSAGLP